MAGFNGRQLIIKHDSTTYVGVRSRGFTIANDYVDVTTDDDAGWRTLLADPATRSVEVTLGGITSDEVLLALAMTASMASETIAATLPSSLAVKGTLAGEWLISSFEETGEHDGAVEFPATFMSTGVITYTASSAS